MHPVRLGLSFSRLGIPHPSKGIFQKPLYGFMGYLRFDGESGFFFLRNQEEPEAPTANALKETKSTVTKSE